MIIARLLFYAAKNAGAPEIPVRQLKTRRKNRPRNGAVGGCLQGPAIQDGNKSLPALAANAPPLRPEVEAFTPENCREVAWMGSRIAEPLALGNSGMLEGV